MTTTVVGTNIPGVHERKEGFDVDTVEAFAALVRQLRIDGYVVNNRLHQPSNVLAQPHLRTGVYAIYPLHIKCLGCERYMCRLAAVTMLPRLDETCDKCGTIVYRHLDEDAIVRFYFDRLDPHNNAGLTMKVKRWDDKTGELFLKLGFLPSPDDLHPDLKTIGAYLDAHNDDWDVLLDEDGELVLVVRHGGSAEDDFPGIVIARIAERKRYTVVVRRKDDDAPDGFVEIPAVTLPVPDCFTITLR